MSDEPALKSELVALCDCLMTVLVNLHSRVAKLEGAVAAPARAHGQCGKTTWLRGRARDAEGGRSLSLRKRMGPARCTREKGHGGNHLHRPGRRKS
jgi:hypothetical protein